MQHADEGTLHTHLDDELSPAELADLRSHLAVCAACRERLDAARRVRDEAHTILRRADPLPVAAPDFAAILARREQEAAPAAPPTPSRPRSLVLAWAASVVLALGAGWFAQDLLRDGGGEEMAAVSTRGAAPMTESAPALAVSNASDVGADAVAPPAVASDPAPTPTPAPPPAAEKAAADAPTVGSDAPAPVDETDVAVALSREALEVPLAARQSAEVSAFRAEAAADAAGEDAEGWSASAEWVEIDAAGAAALLGRPPALLREIAVLGYAAAAEGSAAVRVTQRLPGGELAEVLQRPTSDGLEIIVRAALPADSLERLRGAVR